MITFSNNAYPAIVCIKQRGMDCTMLWRTFTPQWVYICSSLLPTGPNAARQQSSCREIRPGDSHHRLKQLKGSVCVRPFTSNHLWFVTVRVRPAFLWNEPPVCSVCISRNLFRWLGELKSEKKRPLGEGRTRAIWQPNSLMAGLRLSVCQQGPFHSPQSDKTRSRSVRFPLPYIHASPPPTCSAISILRCGAVWANCGGGREGGGPSSPPHRRLFLLAICDVRLRLDRKVCVHAARYSASRRAHAASDQITAVRQPQIIAWDNRLFIDSSQTIWSSSLERKLL